MGRIPKPRCARGQDCYHVRVFHHIDRPPKVGREGDLCQRCAQEHKGAVRTSNNPKWMDEVLDAIRAVRVRGFNGGKAETVSIWDLFELDDTPRHGRSSDFGEALGLSAKTLGKLRDWLDDNTEEAVQRFGEPRCVNVYGTVRTMAWLKALPPDESLFPKERKTNLPLEVVAYTRRGRRVDETTAIKLAQLRQAPRFYSERDLEKLLDTPRTTLRHMMERMDEIGFSLDRFTADELAYVAMGAPRGRKHDS